MARKQAHPDRQLFDYLSGALDARAAQSVEQHLAACSECGSAAELVRVLKSARPTSPDSRHPDAGEIAALFYVKSARARAETTAHVAVCRSCANEIGEYAGPKPRLRSTTPPTRLWPGSSSVVGDDSRMGRSSLQNRGLEAKGSARSCLLSCSTCLVSEKTGFARRLEVLMPHLPGGRSNKACR